MTVIERRLWIQRVNGLRGNILHVARSLKEDSQLGLTGRYLGGTCGRRSSGMLGQRLAIRPGGELQLGLGFAVVGYWHARKLASAPAATTLRSSQRAFPQRTRFARAVRTIAGTADAAPGVRKETVYETPC